MQVCLLRHMPHSCTATEQTPHSLRPHGHLTRRLGKALRGVWYTATIEGLLTAVVHPCSREHSAASSLAHTFRTSVLGHGQCLCHQTQTLCSSLCLAKKLLAQSAVVVKGKGRANLGKTNLHMHCYMLHEPLQVFAQDLVCCLHKLELCKRKAIPDSKSLVHLGQIAAAFCLLLC